MSEVIPFRPKPPDPENLRVIPDLPANRGRDGQGPPIGSKAWSCIDCSCFAFYFTPTETRCYECHRPQVF